MVFLGFKKADFVAKDGKKVQGFKIYLCTSIESEVGEGQECFSYYLSQSKIEKNNLDLSSMINSDVQIIYNRFGKIAEIVIK